MVDLRIKKWEQWLEEGISSDVFTMHLERFAWKRIEEIVGVNQELKGTPSYLWEFLYDIYTKAQAGAVRRQADTKSPAASLGRLIWEVSETPELVSREHWLSLWRRIEKEPYLHGVGERAWTEQYAGSIGDHLDPAIPETDLQELCCGSKKVKDYVDRHVAHMDRRRTHSKGAQTIRGKSAPGSEPPEAPAVGGGELPTLTEIHDAIDLIGRLFSRYSNLLTLAYWTDLTPGLYHDWEAVLRVPWIKG